jgi:predicted negative regulator of RcsB-dependent stress response
MDAPTVDSEDIVFKILGWLHANRKGVIAGAAVVAVLAVGAALYSWNQGQKEIDANAKFLSFPVGPDLRVHASADKLEQLASQYPSTSVGEFSALLAGENYFAGGNFVEANRAFSKFLTDYPASGLASQATMGVAASLEAQGKLSDAVQQYQKAVQTYPTETGVVEPAKLTLGRLFEQQGKFDSAFNEYRDLAQSPNPNDLWASEAKERLQILVGNHPDLLKQVIGSAVSQGVSSAMAGAAAAAAPTAAPTLSAGPAATLSAGPAASNPAPQLLQIPSSSTTAPK